MTKRLVSAAASVAAIGAATLALAPSAMATANGGTCTLQGTANFTTPLTLGPGASPFNYTFSGNLSNCESGNASSGPGPQGMTGTIATPVTASGTGSCATSNSSGIAVVNWSDQKTTVESYTTTGALAAVVQQGTIIPSYTYQSGVDSSGNPVFTTVTTNEPSTPVGDSGLGALTFQPPSPTDCNTGVRSATIRGQIFTGSAS